MCRLPAWLFWTRVAERALMYATGTACQKPNHLRTVPPGRRVPLDCTVQSGTKENLSSAAAHACPVGPDWTVSARLATMAPSRTTCCRRVNCAPPAELALATLCRLPVPGPSPGRTTPSAATPSYDWSAWGMSA